MASADTYREQQDRVLDLISKSDSTTRNRVKNWINMGYNNFVSRELWPFRERVETVNLINGTQEYVLSTEISDIDENNISIVTLQGSPVQKLVYWPYSQLIANSPDTMSGTAIPTRYYLRNGKIGFSPIPNAAMDVDISYFLLSAEMVNDSDEPIIPRQYREALVQYALSYEHDYNTDPDLAQKAMNAYEDIVSLARQNLLAQPADSMNFRILGPADMRNWTGLQDEVI